MVKTRGITLIEILVSVAVMVVVSAFVLANFKLGGRQYEVENTARLVASVIYTAKSLANAGTEFPAGSGLIPNGYGVHFEANQALIIFADTSKDKLYTQPAELYQTAALPSNVAVNSLDSGGSVLALDVFFLPPKLEAYLNGQGPGGATLATIGLVSTQDASLTRSVTVYTNGKVTITK